MGQWFSRFATCIAVVFSCTFLLGINGNDPEPLMYEVEPGDSLSKIAEEFGGHFIWWVAIYEANREKIENPNLIFPDQEFEIPIFIVQNTWVPGTMDDADRVLAMNSKSEHRDKRSPNEKKLEKFRDAFNKLVEKGERNENKQPNVTGYEGLGLGGLILDETRSKMGSNFYSVFYKHWEDPKNVRNFTITVSEKPMPSRGTMVKVEIDNQLVFRNRLEPRYYKTEQAAKQAVEICQRRLQRIEAMENELAGY